MDEKRDKKKESIDEILSDLNGLLNKMPSILDGIKMPEMQPVDFSKPPQASEPPKSAPAGKVPAEPFDADKTVVLESFSGLPDGSPVPAEISSFQAIEPALPQPEPALPGEAEKTIVLESFSGLPEGAASPEQVKPPVQSLGDLMFGADAEPEPENPVAAAPASLSDSPLELPSEKPTPDIEAGPTLANSEFNPPAQNETESATGGPLQDGAESLLAGVPEAALPGIPEAAPGQMVFNQGGDEPIQTSDAAPEAADLQTGQIDEQTSGSVYADEAAAEKQAEAPAYESTRDFGVPDIDALLQMSEEKKPGEQPAQPLPEAGIIPESVQAIEEQKDGPTFSALAESSPESGEAVQVNDSAETKAVGPEEGLLSEPPVGTASAQSLAEFESQFLAAVPQGDIVEVNEPEKAENEVRQPEAVQPAPEPEGLGIEPDLKPETSFEAFTIESSASEPAPAQDAGETLRLEPVSESQPAQDGAEAFTPGSVSEAAPETVKEPQLEESLDIQFGAFLDPVVEPKPEPGQYTQAGSGAEPAAASGIELSPGIELDAGSPAQSASADETLPGGFGLELGSPAAQSQSGDETMVVAPQAGNSGDEDKTVIFQAAPSTTSGAQAGDLPSLSSRQAPEGIPAERVRSVVFLYSPGDEALCASVLAELDAICLKSAAKPMFIKRAYVKECDSDANANFIHQSVADAGAVGLVCVGAVPQEKVYEIENAFSTAGSFFRYYDSSAFNHSSALDLVSDLIIR